MQITKKPKRILSFLLAVVMVMGLLPTTAQALDVTLGGTGEMEISSNTPDMAWTVSGASGSATWTQSTQTLTLNNFKFQTSAAAPLVVPAGTKIVLVGTNTITSTATTPQRAIECNNGAITIHSTEAGSLTLSTNNCSGTNYGIKTSTHLTISGDSRVTINAGASPDTRGIYCAGDLTIASTATVSAKSSGSAWNFGIYCANLNIADGAKVTAECSSGTANGSIVYITNNSSTATFVGGADSSASSSLSFGAIGQGNTLKNGGTVALYAKSVLPKTNVSGKITFNNGSATYTASEQEYKTATISGISAGVNPSWTYTYEAGTGTLGTNSKPQGAGTYTVTATYEDDKNIGTKTATYTINKKALTIEGLTATNRDYAAGNTTVALTGGNLVGVIPEDSGDVTGGVPTSGTIASADAGTGKAVTLTPVALGGAKAANYTVTLPTNLTVEIAKKDPTITWPTGLTAKYGWTLIDVALPGNGSGAGTFSFAEGSISVGSVGTHQFELTFTPTDSTNYNTKTQDVNVTVGKGDYPGAKTAADWVRENVAQTDIDFTLPTPTDGCSYGAVISAIGNLVNTTLPTTVTGNVVSYNVHSKAAGTTDSIYIKINGGNNYADDMIIVTVTATAKIPTTVTVTPPSNVTYGTALGAPSATAAAGDVGTFSYMYNGNLSDGSNIAYSSATPPTNPGTYTVTAALASTTHTGTSSASTPFTIAKKQLSWSTGATVATKVYDGTTTATIATAPTLVGIETGDTVTSDTATATVAFATADAGTSKAVTATNYGITGTHAWKYTAPAAQPVITGTITKATGAAVAIEAEKSAVTHNSVTLTAGTLNAGTDQTLEYAVSTSNSTAPVSGWTTSLTITGLSASTTYYIWTRAAANTNYSAGTAVVEAQSFTTSTAPYVPPVDNGGSSGSYTPQTPEPIAPVIVDGKEVNIGTVTTKDGTAIVTIDQKALDTQISAAHDSIVIPVTTTANTNTVSAQLVVKNVEDIAAKDMTLSVQVGNISYDLPATAIDTKALMEQFGTNDPAKVPISIEISTKVDSATAAKVEASVKKLGGEIVIPAVEFHITANYEGKKVEVDTFNSYVGRSMEITAEQAKKITTAIVVEADKKTRHVPTKVYEKDGKWYAEINSRTNSTYVLINKKVSFNDIKGKSYESMAKELSARKIMTGFAANGAKTFGGEKKITNSGLALVLVRALGLPENGNYSAFKNVTKETQYAGALGTAYEYGIITKGEAAKFVPGAKISRQDAMVMVARAAKVANYKGKSVSVATYSDASLIKKENLSGVKFCVGSGLDKGAKGKLRPTESITRAEAGSMVLKLLQKAKLI